LPEQYRGKHFFSEWGKAGVYVTEVARDGATFKLVSDTKLIEPEKGADFRPMQLSVAADGSLLIADWGYGGWKSPRVAGAIWRLSWPEAKPAPRLKEEGKATVDELIAALGHADRDQRLRAETELVARGLKLAMYAQPPAESYVQFVEKIRAAFHARENSAIRSMHLVWVLEQTSALQRGWNSPAYFASSLVSEMAAAGPREVRSQAWRALGMDRMMGAFQEDTKADPSLRLRAVIAAKRLQMDQLLQTALNDEDAWVRFAARTSLRARGVLDFHTELTSGKTAPERLEQIWLTLAGSTHESAMKSLFDAVKAKDASIRRRAAELLGQVAYQAPPYDGHWWGTQPVKSPPPPNSVAWSGTPEALSALTGALADADSGVRLAAAKAFTAFTLKPAGASPAELGAGAALRARLTAESEPAIRRQLIESLGVQKDVLAVDVFRQIALDEKADPEFRETAIGAVVNIGGDAAKQTITQLAAAKLSPGATRKIIIAAGQLKVLEAAPALIRYLQDEDAGHREFAARSLRQLGPKSNSGPALIALLTDKDGKVVAAAVDALGSFRERAALPGIIALLEKKKALRETTGALVLMPDETAIPVLVETLRDKNTTFRRNAIKALKTMRVKAWPQVEALLASGRVPEELVPEIRNAFDSGAITQWKMVGVFENVWEAVHPPEKDALANGGVPNLTAKYHNAEGKDVGWIEVTGDADAGRVDLDKVFKTSAMVCAYAFTEIDAPEAAEAKLFTSADDEIGVWLNGQQVLNQPGNHGYEADKNETRLPLHAGKNRLFVKIGNKGGSWVFHARIPGFENGKFIKSKEPAPDEKQRLLALAMKPDGAYIHAGDAKKGEKLFFDQGAAMGGICATCHAVNGKGGQAGPDLSAIAANYKRPDLITSIHEPSKTIALGFEQVMVETKGGDIVAGALRQETGETLTLTGADGQPHVVKKADVKTKTHIPTSLMPPGLTLGLKAEDFVDLLAYLESLKGK
jgi:putative heme-binding domain-containing protein